MKKKLAWRIPLDIVLVLLFTTVFSKNVISLMYHEVVGLVLFALIILHLFLNSAWIKGVCAKLFDKKLPKKTRVTIGVDILLLISFLLIIVSGILISKKIFSFGLKAPWIVIHFFCTALMIILIGVHIGLHWGYLKQKLPKPPKMVALVLTVVICVFGVYSMFTSSFGTWLSRPFVKFEGHGEQQEESAVEAQRGAEQSADRGAPTVEKAEGQPEENWQGDAAAQSETSGQRGGHEQQPFSLVRLLTQIATYFSILYAIGKVTNLVDESAWKKRAVPA